MSKNNELLLIFLLVMLLNNLVYTQDFDIIGCCIYSGRNSNTINADFQEVYNDTIIYEDAAHMRVYFSDFNLGAKSFIKLRSLENSTFQILDAETMNKRKEYFIDVFTNELEIALYVANGEREIFKVVEDHSSTITC